MNKKLVASVLVALGVIVSGAIWYQTSGNGFATYEVELSDIENVTTLVGTVKANQDLDLGFEVSGKIENVYFVENQSVNAGDLIIELNKADLFAQRVQASANLKDAQSSLKQQEQQVLLEETRLEDLRSGGSESEIRVAERNVDLRREELRKAEQALEEGLKNNALELENILKESEVVLTASLNQAVSSLYSLTDLQLETFGIETSESILVGFHKARAAEQLLGIKNAERFNVRVLSESKGGLLEKIQNVNFEDINQVNEYINELKNVYNEINSAYLSFSVDEDFSDSDFTTLNTDKNTVSSEISGLNVLRQSILNTSRNNESSESNLRSSVSVAGSSLEQARSELDRVRDGADENDLRIQEIAIEQAKSLLESRQSRVQFEFGRIAAINADIEKRNIVSPIDGEIVDLELAKGEIVTPGDKVVSVQAENDLLIEIDSPERFISFIKDGQEVEVVLDAFPRKTLVGKVAKVSKESTLVDNVPVFKVDISLDPDGENVRSGMTGDVVVILDKAQEVRAIPAENITRDNGKIFVNKITSKDPFVFEKTEIEIGVSGSDGMVEVISGLSVGDEILVNKSDD